MILGAVRRTSLTSTTHPPHGRRRGCADDSPTTDISAVGKLGHMPANDNPASPTAAPIGTAPPRSLAENAYQSIRDMLVTVRIRPGAPLSEEQLTRHLGMGRTPVREAIKRL